LKNILHPVKILVCTRISYIKSGSYLPEPEFSKAIPGENTKFPLIKENVHAIRDHPYITSSRYRGGGGRPNMTIDDS
jgi:hypothetical protein